MKFRVSSLEFRVSDSSCTHTVQSLQQPQPHQTQNLKPGTTTQNSKPETLN